MADFLLMILTVIIVGLGAFQLGRLTQKDRIEFLIDELQAERSLSADLLRVKQRAITRGLHAVKDDK